MWTEELYQEIFGQGVDHAKLPMHEFLKGLGHWERDIPEDPGKRTIGKLQRMADGKFSDDDLVKILTESIEDPAGLFSPSVFPSFFPSLELFN